jgi:hypothetical protein
MIHSIRCDLVRRCLYFDELVKVGCDELATHVCMDRDGLQWFGCQAHADQHSHLRMDLATFQECVTKGAIDLESWELAPGAQRGTN